MALNSLIRKVQVWERGKYNRTAENHRDPSMCQTCAKVFTNIIHLNLHSASKGNFYSGFTDETMRLREDMVTRSYD